MRFTHCKPKGQMMIPWSPACKDPRGMTDRIYKGDYLSMHCYTQYTKALGYGFREEDNVFCVVFFHCRIWKRMIPGVGPLLTTGE